MPVVLLPLARTAPRLAERFGINRVVALGLTLSASGMVVMTTLEVQFVYWHLTVGLVLFAAGMGLARTPATAVAGLPAGIAERAQSSIAFTRLGDTEPL